MDATYARQCTNYNIDYSLADIFTNIKAATSGGCFSVVINNPKLTDKMINRLKELGYIVEFTGLYDNDNKSLQAIIYW